MLGDGFADGLRGCAAGVRVYVDSQGEDVGAAEDGLGVRAEEGEDDAGAGAEFEEERRWRGWREVGLQPECFGGGGEGVEQEVRVLCWFVDGGRGDVRGRGGG